jgi:acetoin utilization deacetylase AcuC-like enzyme
MILAIIFDERMQPGNDFGEMTNILRDFCTRCGIGIVSVLEGGYNPEALAASIRQHLTNLS